MLESEAPLLDQMLRDFLNSPVFAQIDLFCQPIEIPQYPISDYYQNGRFQHLEFVMHLSAMYQRADLETKKLELQKKIKEFDKKRDAALAKNQANIKQSDAEREKTHQKTYIPRI